MTEKEDAKSHLETSIRPHYYTPREVAVHNQATDCWVSLHHRVFNLSPLIQQNPGILVEPLIQHAGEDISHWFDVHTDDIKYHVDPKCHVSMPFVPYGPFLHVPPPNPTTLWCTDVVPWWRDANYIVGRLTKKVRGLEIVNMLTQHQHALEVCCEETIDEIQTRYLSYNAHATSYTWKYLQNDGFVPLTMHFTLEENGIPDDSLLLEHFDMDEHLYKPIVHLYFNDDLTVL